MIRKLWHIYRLGLKELISFRYDYVLMMMVIYCFTVMVIVPAKGTGVQVRNSSVAYIDEDQSTLSQRIIDSIQQPFFQKPQAIIFHRAFRKTCSPGRRLKSGSTSTARSSVTPGSA
jgi:ABC-2 type transport system permease protein